jgi:hypothetical protein
MPMTSTLESEPGADAPRQAGRHPQEARRGALLAVGAVAILYVLAQTALFDWSTFYLGRDEAIYLSQVDPRVEALDMAIHRTRRVVAHSKPGRWANCYVWIG